MNYLAHHERTAESVEYDRTAEVQPATAADAQAIYELINAETELKQVELDEVRQWIETGLSVVVREADGRITGHSGAIEVHPEFFEVRGVVVVAEQRGHGVAARLQTALLSEIDRRFAGSAIYWVATDHPGSRRLIEHMGGIPLTDAERETLLAGPLQAREGSLESRDVYLRPSPNITMEYDGQHG
jgi:N-acetylglutamate synthase-like GNAT family acetyltransferase